jgi:uncharacterized protein GlcG (DUF336 family)
MGHSECHPAARRPWNADRKIGAKRGGAPIFENSHVAGAIGVACADPEIAGKIAHLALETWNRNGAESV